MADRSGRSPGERETARLERARKRAERSGQMAAQRIDRAPVPPGPAPASDRPSVPPAPAPDPAPPAGEPDPAPPAAAPDQDWTPVATARRFEPEPAGGWDEDIPESDEDMPEPDADGQVPGEDQPVLEMPSGTRRVSHREKPIARRQQPVGRREKSVAAARERRARRPGQRQRAAQTGRHSWIGRVASLVALALAGGLIWFLVALFQPFGGSPHGSVTVTVPAGSTSSQIGDLLARDGVIPSSFFFELRATLAGDRGSMRSGIYHLKLGMSYSAVLTALTTPPRAAKVTALTIAEGRRRQQIDALLRAQHIGRGYLAATRSSKLLDLRAYGLRRRPPSLEGFLFPDTYQLVDPVRISALVADQLRTFKQQFAKVNLAYPRRRHLTPYDVLVIASLIEAETPTTHDRPLVASVIYNRLADGMSLGLDSTTQYATGNFSRPLTVSQLQSNSPYNTRTHVGLPPTPIDNPGLASMQAAAHPAQTRYLYFFAKPCQPGSVFASNYAQFLALNSRYQSTRC